MRSRVFLPVLTLAAAGILAATLAGPLMSQVEQSPYQVERNEGAIELRAYPPLTVAQTVVDGERGPAINKGFRILASYIFGANYGAKKIEMTAPVMQGRDRWCTTARLDGAVRHAAGLDGGDAAAPE